MSDKNIADILKEAEGLQTPPIKNTYNKGFLTAQLKYVVNYKCCGCGKMITIDTQEEKEAVAQYIKEHGWAHSECSKNLYLTRSWSLPFFYFFIVYPNNRDINKKVIQVWVGMEWCTDLGIDWDISHRHNNNYFISYTIPPIPNKV